jgi:hypothetical protein
MNIPTYKQNLLIGYVSPIVFVTDGSRLTSGSCQNPSLTCKAFTAGAAGYAFNELKRDLIMAVGGGHCPKLKNL